MATTVAQHSVATFTSPVNGTTPIDANTVRGNDNTIRTAYNDHDSDPGIHVQSSTLASRPVAGTAGRKWITTDAGSQKLWYDDGTDWHEVGGDSINVYCKATQTLAKGDVVKITGYNTGQNTPEIAKVSSASDVAFGICETAIANGSLGYVINTGTISDVATNSFSLGDILYPNTSGGLTATKPTSGNYQMVAYVLRSHASNGVLYVEFSGPRIVEASANTASTIVRRDASGNFTAGTVTVTQLDATTVNTTTLDLTNLEVTNIKAKDGTASATIADSTGVMTITSSVLTTTDINGGTIDGTTIGGSSAAAGTFTTVAATTGNITTVNATTVDTTNIEVTNLKAKDGTSAATIADSTGVVTFTSTVSGSITGNAGTATALQTARTINGTSFDGTANITVTAAAGTLTGTTLASNVVSSSLTSVGTLSSLTVSGNVTVDTNTLFVDSSNNRVGIGTATPSYRADIANTGGSAAALRLTGNDQSNVRLRLENSGTGGVTWELTGGLTGANNSHFSLYDATAATTRLSVDGSGNLAVDTNTLYVDAANNRVGVGTASPSESVEVSASNVMLKLNAATNSFAQLGYYENGALKWNVYNDYVTDEYRIGNASGTIVQLSQSGNLGLGVTPKAWSASFRAMEAGAQPMYGSTGANNVLIGSNWYNDGTDKYGTTGAASRFIIKPGSYEWQTAPSGTAGNAISFTQVAEINASGEFTVAPGSTQTVKITTGAAVRCANTTNTSGYDVGLLGGASDATGFIYNRANAPVVFGTNNAERARITSGGYTKHSNDGTYFDATGAYHEFRQTANNMGLRLTSTVAGFTSMLVYGNTSTAAGTGFDMLNFEANGVGQFRVRGDGTIYAQNTTVQSISDARLKENVVTSAQGLDVITALRPVRYDWKAGHGNDRKNQLGFIAQEVEPVFADAVDEWEMDGETYKTVGPAALIPVLVKAIQELDTRLKALEA